MKSADVFRNFLTVMVTVICFLVFISFTDYRRDRFANGWKVDHSKAIIDRPRPYVVYREGSSPSPIHANNTTIEHSEAGVTTYTAGRLRKVSSVRKTSTARLYPNDAQVSDENKLLFIHIPKTGGTTIEKSFLFSKKVIGGHHKISEFDVKYFEKFHKFAMVRHPCSRLLSAWSYLSQRRGNGKDTRWAKANLTEETASSFSSFIKKTLAPEGHVMPSDENHLQTQVGMIFREDGSFGLDQLLIFEKWTESIDVLASRVKMDLEKLKVTHRRRGHHGACEESYTPETWNKMVKLYSMDFCVLGYSTDINHTSITPQFADLTPAVLTARYRTCT